jgi:hypothetical protein
LARWDRRILKRLRMMARFREKELLSWMKCSRSRSESFSLPSIPFCAYVSLLVLIPGVFGHPHKEIWAVYENRPRRQQKYNVSLKITTPCLSTSDHVSNYPTPHVYALDGPLKFRASSLSASPHKKCFKQTHLYQRLLVPRSES